MQRATTPQSGRTSRTGPIDDTDCPVCGEPVRGIEAAKPGEHRFVGCGHYASARFLRRRVDTVGPGVPRLRLGP